MAHDFPRVSIVSLNPLRNDQTNGILMSSLFRGWPQSRLHQIYFRHLVDHAPHGDVCRNFSVIDLLGRAGTFQADRMAAVHGVEPPTVDAMRAVTRALRGSRWLVDCARFAQEMWQIHGGLVDTLRTMLRRSRPDVVYSFVGNYSLARLVTDACRDLALPLFMHVSDDFTVGAYQQAPLALLRHASVKAFSEMISYASGRAACSPLMAAEFARRYRTPWYWFTTLVDEKLFDPTPCVVPGRLHCVFAGNLNLGRWQTLQLLACALQQLRQDCHVDARLDIYSSHEQLAPCRQFLEYPGATAIKGWAAPAALPEIFRKADVLVHVESFDPMIIPYARYSLSSKLSQYLMAGRCILALGPHQTGSISLVPTLSAGLAIHETSVEKIFSGLHQLRDIDWRTAAARNGRRWARQWLDRKGSQPRFLSALQATALREDPSSREPNAYDLSRLPDSSIKAAA